MKKKNVQKFNVKRSVFLLLLIAVFLILSTYAWFTSNTLVKIETIEVNVATSAGFQISVDAVNWKSVISRDDILGQGAGTNAWVTGPNQHNNHIPSSTYMEPVSTVGERDSATGYLNMFHGVVDANDITGQLELTATTVPDSRTSTGATSLPECPFIAFDVFFKVTQTAELMLDIDSNVIGGPNTAGLTKGLENAVRVGFVKQGHILFEDYEESTGVDTTRALKNGEIYAGGGSWGNVDTRVVFWEPNSNSHTDQAQADARNSWGLGPTDVLQQTKVTPYSGVRAEFLTGRQLPTCNPTSAPTLFGAVTASTTPLTTPYAAFDLLQTEKPIDTDPLVTYYQNFGDGQFDTDPLLLGLTLEPGITKVRIYMWIEGQDYDCQDFASGTNLEYNLSFTI